MRDACRRMAVRAGLIDGHTHAARFVRFLAAGGVNTLFGFAVYSLAILAGLDVWLGLLVSTIAGTLFNFLTMGGYVFRQLSPARLPAFIGCYLAVYGVNLVLIETLMGWLGGKILAQLVLAFPMALLSYLLMSRLVFRGVPASGRR